MSGCRRLSTNYSLILLHIIPKLGNNQQNIMHPVDGEILIEKTGTVIYVIVRN
jgi:hypothetical protein